MVQTQITLIYDQMKVLKRFPAFWELIPENGFFGSNLTGLGDERRYPDVNSNLYLNGCDYKITRLHLLFSPLK